MKKRVFEKYKGNPILRDSDMPGDIWHVFNPGAIKHNGEYILMMNASTLSLPIIFWLARSKDGINFVPDTAPIEWPAIKRDYPEICVYDPRITKIGNEYIIAHASSSKHGVQVGVVKTTDFKKFDRVGICSEQGNRNAAIFPEKIKGKYVRLDRPTGDPIADPAGIWISYSEDLIHWGENKPLMEPRAGFWDCQKIGAGAVPIKTKQGWLEIYHGVFSHCCGFVYRLGVCLLDLDDPSKVIARGEDAVLWPEHDYECFGNVTNTVFTANAILEPDNTVKIYYGAADRCIGLAQANLEDLIQACYNKNAYLSKFFRKAD